MKSIPYRRETFSKKRILIDFSTDFNRVDESVLQDQHVSKNVVQLTHSIDSMRLISRERSKEQSDRLIRERYFGRESVNEVHIPEALTAEQKQHYSWDSLWASLDRFQQRQVLSIAHERACTYRDQVTYHAIMLDDANRYIRKHEIELYRKFTLAFACLIFFFIGAPLGTIIRREVWAHRSLYR